jgi:hypothetical protein
MPFMNENYNTIFSYLFTIYSPTSSKPIAYNVPAVYDVFAVAIKEHEVFQQPQKCAGEKHHKGR